MRRTCGFYHQPPDMYQAPVGNMFSPVGRDRGGIVDEWGGASNFVTNEWGNASNFVSNEWGGASNFVSSSSRGRRGRWSDSSDGRSYRLLQQSYSLLQLSKEKESKKIKKLEKELKLMRKDKEALQRRVDQLEKLQKTVKIELPSTVAEDDMHRVAKDFEVQFDKTWKESYEIQIKKEPEQAAIQCNTCDSIFKTVGLLRRHMRCEHSSVITSNQ